MRARHPSLALALAAVLGCDSERQVPPPAQESASEAATTLVRTRAGQPFSPPCILVSTGATVEWRNRSPRTAISVLSVQPPYELSSPALLAPYNSVPADGSECAQRDEHDQCIAPLPYVFWRHTFSTPGVFDYRDFSGGAAAPTAGGYGLPPGPMLPASGVATGTVCVPGQSPGDCQQICCTGSRPDECAPFVQCIAGRCGGVQLTSPTTQQSD